MSFIEVLVLMAIPSSVTAFAFWLLEKRLAEKDKRAEKNREDYHKFRVCILECISATLRLSEVTAKSLQRVSDEVFCEDMHEALNSTRKAQESLQTIINSSAMDKLGV